MVQKSKSKTDINNNMKHVLFVFACLASWQSLCAQALKMLGEGVVWCYNQDYYVYGQPRSTFDTETLYRVTGTEQVDGKTYFRVAVESVLTGSRTSENGHDSWPAVLLREEDGKVYVQRQSYIAYMQSGSPEITVGAETYIAATDDTEQVLYDFTLVEGDRYPLPGEVTVKEVKSVTSTDGVERRLFRLSNDMLILEGIGCLNCHGELIGYQSADRIIHYGDYAESRGFFNSYYPQGENAHGVSFDYGVWNVTSISTIATGKKRSQANGYDLQGHRLNTPSRRGLYIRDGRKMVVR